MASAYLSKSPSHKTVSLLGCRWIGHATLKSPRPSQECNHLVIHIQSPALPVCLMLLRRSSKTRSGDVALQSAQMGVLEWSHGFTNLHRFGRTTLGGTLDNSWTLSAQSGSEQSEKRNGPLLQRVDTCLHDELPLQPHKSHALIC